MNSASETATFAAGCFWNVEAVFRPVAGVLETTVGYMGGSTPDPSYEQVCSHATGHAEVVQIRFDPKRVSFEQLLDIFWKHHNPTTLNRQGPDVGSQYRSAIFFHTPEQEEAAQTKKSELESSGQFKQTIVTEITAASTFYPAEEYHQCYFEKHPHTGK